MPGIVSIDGLITKLVLLVLLGTKMKSLGVTLKVKCQIAAITKHANIRFLVGGGLCSLSLCAKFTPNWKWRENYTHTSLFEPLSVRRFNGLTENDGHEIDGPSVQTWNWRTWKCRTWNWLTWKWRTWNWRTRYISFENRLHYNAVCSSFQNNGRIQATAEQ